jgi:hypothetical protein
MNDTNERCVGSAGSADAPKGFTEELAGLLNRHSMENGSGTPDFILARHLTSCLVAWNCSMREREAWHGRSVNAMTQSKPLGDLLRELETK